jgi:hypothetical protein
MYKIDIEGNQHKNNFMIRSSSSTIKINNSNDSKIYKYV